jgi:hypothetical protein
MDYIATFDRWHYLHYYGSPQWRRTLWPDQFNRVTPTGFTTTSSSGTRRLTARHRIAKPSIASSTASSSHRK